MSAFLDGAEEREAGLRGRAGPKGDRSALPLEPREAASGGRVAGAGQASLGGWLLERAQEGPRQGGAGESLDRPGGVSHLPQRIFMFPFPLPAANPYSMHHILKSYFPNYRPRPI